MTKIRNIVMAVAQEVERSSTNWKIGGLIPGSSSPRVDVSLGKTLNPKLLPLLRQQCMNENEWLNSPQVGTLHGSSYHQCMNMGE